MNEKITVNRVSVCTYADFDDSEQLLQYFDRIRKLNKPRQFSSQIVDIDTDEIMDGEITISKSGPSPDEEADVNEIIIDVQQVDDSSPDRLHVHMNGDKEGWEMANSIFEKVVGIVGEVETYIIVLHAEVETEFDQLNLPVDRDRGYDIGGIDFKRDTKGCLIQSRGSEQPVYFRYTELAEFYLDQEEAGEIVQSTKEDLSEFVKELES